MITYAKAIIFQNKIDKTFFFTAKKTTHNKCNMYNEFPEDILYSSWAHNGSKVKLDERRLSQTFRTRHNEPVLAISERNCLMFMIGYRIRAKISYVSLLIV